MTTGAAPIPDVQAKHDSRQIAIDKVGVRGIRYPITSLFGVEPTFPPSYQEQMKVWQDTGEI